MSELNSSTFSEFADFRHWLGQANLTVWCINSSVSERVRRYKDAMTCFQRIVRESADSTNPVRG